MRPLPRDYPAALKSSMGAAVTSASTLKVAEVKPVGEIIN